MPTYHTLSDASDTTIHDVYPIGTMIMSLYDNITGLVIDWDKDYSYVNILVDGEVCNVLATELTYWRIHKPSAKPSRD